MAREGREFELLIKKLEAILLPQNAIINSPDFILDKVTNQKREVDISIRIETGSLSFLAVIECRDRKAIEDITWIEQLNAKTKDLNVNKVIAVSTSGFSENAIKKAKHYGIEVRTYAEISLEKIQDWFSVEHLDLYVQDYRILHIEIDLGDVSLNELATFNQNVNSEKFITEMQTNRQVSAKDIFHALLDETVWQSIPPDNNFYLRTINVSFKNPENRYKIENEGKIYLLESIVYTVELKVDPKKVPLSRVTSYNNDEGAITHVVEFDGALPDSKQTLQFIKSKDGSFHFSTRNNIN